MKFQVADCGAELWFGRKGECCLNWLDAFPVSSLWVHQQRAQWVRSLVAARRHRKPTVSRPTCQYSSQLRVCVPAPPPDGPGVLRPRPLTVQGFLRPRLQASLGSWPHPCVVPSGILGWRDSLFRRARSGQSPACSCEDRSGGRWRPCSGAGIRGHDSVGPRLLAAPRPPGPSVGVGPERGVALGGAGNGRARVPGLSEQRLEVRALPDARPPRVRALPGAKPLAVGGAAAASAGEALTREAGGSGQPCGAAGLGARPALAPNLAAGG